MAAAGIALIAWSGLALQLWLLLIPSPDWIATTVSFFSYFTVLANTLVASTLTAWLLGRERDSGLASIEVRSAAAVYIASIGIAYTILLKALWNPTGLQALADVLLHDVVPIVYVGYWLVFVEKGTLRFSMPPRWLTYPLLFLLYSLVRGAVAGWYPYPFIDVSSLGYGRVMLNVTMLVISFLGLGWLFVGVDKALGTWRGRQPVSAERERQGRAAVPGGR
jgi:hypothetical protein